MAKLVVDARRAWRPSTSSTARTRPASAATCRARPARAAWMVGASGMGPGPDLDRTASFARREREEATERLDEALREDRPPADEPGERRLPARPDRRRPRRPDKRALAAQILGQAYRRTRTSWSSQNKDAIEHDRRHARRQRKELYGDELDRPAQLGRTEGAEGRPEQGGDVADIVSEQPAPLTRPKPEPSVSRHRFGVAYLVLAAIVGGAVGLVVVFATGHDDKGGQTLSGSRWSSWTPTATGTLGVREIARHVSADLPARQRPPARLGRRRADADSTRPGSRPCDRNPHQLGNRRPVAGAHRGHLPERRRLLIRSAGVSKSVNPPPSRPSPSSCCSSGRRWSSRCTRSDTCPRRTPSSTSCLRAQVSTRAIRATTGRSISRAPRSPMKLQMPLNNTIPTLKGGISPSTLSPSDADRVLGILAGHTFHYAYQQAPDSSALLQLTPIEP